MAPHLFTSALSTLSNDVGLTVPGDASGISGSSTFDNGLSTNRNFNQPNFNPVSTTPSTPGGVPKPPLVDFKFEANRLLGEDNIKKYLNGFKNPNSDKNIAFQDLVNNVVGQTFQTPGGIDPRMREIMGTFYNSVTAKAREHILSPNDENRRNALARELMNMGNVIKPGAVPVQSDDVPVMPVQSDDVPVMPVQSDDVPVMPVQADQTQSAPSQGWRLSNLKFWGGRKPARNHSRNHSRSHKRSRSRKQYKKLKRSSRSRRR
jgi:hypothetical protein